MSLSLSPEELEICALFAREVRETLGSEPWPAVESEVAAIWQRVASEHFPPWDLARAPLHEMWEMAPAPDAQ